MELCMCCSWISTFNGVKKMNFQKMIDELIFNEKLHKSKGLLPHDHPNTGNLNIIALWNRTKMIEEWYSSEDEENEM